jgi:putative phosphoesterase
MNIGLLSDTHDNMDKIQKAVELLNESGVEFVIHCGDLVSPFAAVPLRKLKCEYIGVFGNNDGDLLMINKVTDNRFYKPPKKIVVDNKSIVLFHEPFIYEDVNENIEFVFYGHTHKKDLKKKGQQIIVNPGTVSGYLTDESTFCIVNLASKIVEFLKL